MNIDIIYSPEMVVNVDSYSPSPSKAKLLVDLWKDRCCTYIAPKPATLKDFYTTHDEEYVNGVFSKQLENGFGTRSNAVNTALSYTNGAMITATERAINTGNHVGALCSGFHHAGYSFGGGFCTFNGLIMASLYASTNLGAKVGILDADEHYGNGTVDIINHLELDIPHYTVGMAFSTPSQVNTFFKRLPAIVDSFVGCDALIYQAGADPYINDPLGGWLTIPQLRERDRIVFSRCHKMGIPVAWNLAGGYSNVNSIKRIHTNTLLECWRVYNK